MINVQTTDGFRIFRNNEELLDYIGDKLGDEIKEVLEKSIEERIERAIADECEFCEPY